MDPVTLGIQAIGIGMKLGGGLSSMFGGQSFADEYNKQEQQKFQLEKQVQQQRQGAMELSARRQQLEIFRNTQRARAMGINASVNQGAQFGTGMLGGIFSTQSQGNFNALGVSQNLEIGRNIFGLNQQITDVNAKESSLKAQYQSDQALSKGISDLGNSIMGSAGTLGNIGGYIGNSISNWAMPPSNVGIG